jgi:tetratricopeptide (TPR) repeat protein
MTALVGWTSVLQRAIVTLALCAMAFPASAQVGSDVVDPWQEARTLYGDGNYEEAGRYIVEALQRSPRNTQYVLGLARTYNWLTRYDEAVFYYDLYLVDLLSELPDNLAARDRIDAVRAERDSANEQRQESASPVQMPAQQDIARDAVRQRISEGPILTESGGGAVAMYWALLRTGYARPDLGLVRADLRAALESEIRRDVASNRATIPVLNLRAWTTHQQRLIATEDLLDEVPSGSPELSPDLTAIRLFIDGQLQMLNENPGPALAQFDAAIALSPTLLPAHIARLNALLATSQSGRPEGEAALAAARTAIDRADPARIGFVSIYEAAFAAQAGRTRDAAEQLHELLR